MTNFNMTIAKDDNDRRLDRILRKAFKDFPLSFIHRLIRNKQILINDIPAKMDSRVHEGDILSVKGNITLPAKTKQAEAAFSSGKVSGKSFETLDILYEGSFLIILNKPSGLEVHGEHSLETMVLHYLKDKIPPSLSFRPGPLHRLDKPTSGIIAFSKSLEGARSFSEALQNRNVKKYYMALMDGIIEKNEVWEDLLFRDEKIQKTLSAETSLLKDKGQDAIMKVHPLITSADASNAKYTFAFIELETGRTHQIRAQGSIHHHSLAGDKKYGGSFLQGGFFLHAVLLSLAPDIAPDLPRLMIAPIPAEKKHILTSIFGDKIKQFFEKSSLESFIDGIMESGTKLG